MASIKFAFFIYAAIAVATNCCKSQTTEETKENAEEYKSKFASDVDLRTVGRLPNDTRIFRKISKRSVSKKEGNSGQTGANLQVLTKIPRTSFSCYKLQNGYYADLEVNCQVFHICDKGRKVSFLCPQGTIFQQAQLICDWWFKVDCQQSPTFHRTRERLLEENEKQSKLGTTNTVYQPEDEAINSRDIQIVENYNYDGKQNGRINPYHESLKQTNISPNRDKTKSVQEFHKYQVLPRQSRRRNNNKTNKSSIAQSTDLYELAKTKLENARFNRRKAEEMTNKNVKSSGNRASERIRNFVQPDKISNSLRDHKEIYKKIEDKAPTWNNQSNYMSTESAVSVQTNNVKPTSPYQRSPERPSLITNQNSYYNENNNKRHLNFEGFGNNGTKSNEFQEELNTVNGVARTPDNIGGRAMSSYSSNQLRNQQTVIMRDKQHMKYVSTTTTRSCNPDNHTRETSRSDIQSIEESFAKSDIGDGVRETPGDVGKPRTLLHDMIDSKNMYNMDGLTTASMKSTTSGTISNSVFYKNTVSTNESITTSPKAGTQNPAEKIQRTYSFTSNIMKGRTTYPLKPRNAVNMFESLKELEEKVPVLTNTLKFRNTIMNMSRASRPETLQPLALYFSVASDKYDAKELEDLIVDITDEARADDATVSRKSNSTEKIMNVVMHETTASYAASFNRSSASDISSTTERTKTDNFNMAYCKYYIHYLNIRETDKSLCDTRELNKVDQRVERTTSKAMDSYRSKLTLERFTTDFPSTTELLTADNTLIHNNLTREIDYESSTINMLGSNTRSSESVALCDCNSSSSHGIHNQNGDIGLQNKSTTFSEAYKRMKIGNRDLNRNRMISFVPPFIKSFVNSPNFNSSEDRSNEEVNNQSTLSYNYDKEEEDIAGARKFGIANTPAPNDKVPAMTTYSGKKRGGFSDNQMYRTRQEELAIVEQNMNYESEVTTSNDYMFEDFNDMSVNIDALENVSEEGMESVEIINVNMDDISPRNSVINSRESTGKQKNTTTGETRKMEAASDSLLPSVVPLFWDAPVATTVIKSTTDATITAQIDRSSASYPARELFHNFTRIKHSDIGKNNNAKELISSRRSKEEKNIPAAFTLLPVAFRVNDTTNPDTNLPAISNTSASEPHSTICSNQHGNAIFSVVPVFESETNSSATESVLLPKYISLGKINDTCLSTLMPVMKQIDNKLVKRLIVLLISNCAETKNKTMESIRGKAINTISKMSVDPLTSN